MLIFTLRQNSLLYTHPLIRGNYAVIKRSGAGQREDFHSLISMLVEIKPINTLVIVKSRNVWNAIPISGWLITKFWSILERGGFLNIGGVRNVLFR